MVFTEIQILIDGDDCGSPKELDQEQPLGKFLQKSLDKALAKKSIVHNAHSHLCDYPDNTKRGGGIDNELDAILGFAHTQDMMMMQGPDDAEFFQQQHNANSHYIYKGGFKGLYCPKEKKANHNNRRLRSTASTSRKDDDNNNSGDHQKHEREAPSSSDKKKKKPKKPKCVTVDRVAVSESFREGSDVSKWTHGKIGSYGDTKLSIMGPYRRNESTNTSFVLENGVDMAVLKFDFLEIGTWTDKDYLGVTIGGKEKFGLKEALRLEGKVRSGHTKGGVSWAVKAKTHSFTNGFSHRVVIHVPKAHFTPAKTAAGSRHQTLDFQINIKGNAGGMDNFQLSTRTMCSKKLPKVSSTSAELPREQLVEDKLSDYITRDLQQHFHGCEFAEAHVHVYSRERWEDAKPQCHHNRVDEEDNHGACCSRSRSWTAT